MGTWAAIWEPGQAAMWETGPPYGNLGRHMGTASNNKRSNCLGSIWGQSRPVGTRAAIWEPEPAAIWAPGPPYGNLAQHMGAWGAMCVWVCVRFSVCDSVYLCLTYIY